MNLLCNDSFGCICFLQAEEENYSNSLTALFHVLFKVTVQFLLLASAYLEIFRSILGVSLVLIYIDNLYFHTMFTECVGFVFWQGSAIAFYILFSFFINSFIIQFVVTVFLAALDFWVVKNVSGRILVGL